MSIKPFDDNGSFFVLVSDDEQYSLWPASADLPGGWRAVCGEADRCMSELHRTELARHTAEGSARDAGSGSGF